MKCDNCNKEALFEYKINKVNSVFYCGKDLPSFLNERKKAGLLTITEAHKESSVTALEALSTPKPETTEQTPIAPKKKATTKKSAK